MEIIFSVIGCALLVFLIITAVIMKKVVIIKKTAKMELPLFQQKITDMLPVDFSLKENIAKNPDKIYGNMDYMGKYINEEYFPALCHFNSYVLAIHKTAKFLSNEKIIKWADNITHQEIKVIIYALDKTIKRYPGLLEPFKNGRAIIIPVASESDKEPEFLLYLVWDRLHEQWCWKRYFFVDENTKKNNGWQKGVFIAYLKQD